MTRSTSDPSPVAKEAAIAGLAVASIVAHFAMRAAGFESGAARAPLFAGLVIGGAPLVFELALRAMRREFGSDLLAGVSIVTALLLDEPLAGVFVVLMLSGGETLERYASARASSVLDALARRMPSVAHRRVEGGSQEVALDAVRPGDELLVLPHESCPVDGVVIEGRGTMDESYLTGEPYLMSKAPGSDVLSGAVNGETMLVIRATRPAVDSRYAKIMQVMRKAEEQRPAMRRLADRLGAFYTPLALAVAGGAWAVSGDPIRFLAVLVVATPCPLLIAIPICIVGAISLAARRGIVVRDPGVMERIDDCHTIIFDKTGTLSYGRPELTEENVAPGLDADETLRLVAGIERYSKHPLARALMRVAAKRGLTPPDATEISEPPGAGLVGRVEGREIRVTNRARASADSPAIAAALPPQGSGMECVVLLDGAFAARYRFNDAPRDESRPFIRHLAGRHGIRRVMLVSGDRESEVRYLADLVGIKEVRASQSPENKVEIVREENAKAPTIFVGDGINDAPALMAATVGIAFGQASDVTGEAAQAVMLEPSLVKVDEFFHIGRRMRTIALQSAVGGMLLSVGGMGFAAAGMLPPVAGAVLQEIIDVAAILNALRAARAPKDLTDFERS